MLQLGPEHGPASSSPAAQGLHQRQPLQSCTLPEAAAHLCAPECPESRALCVDWITTCWENHVRTAHIACSEQGYSQGVASKGRQDPLLDLRAWS